MEIRELKYFLAIAREQSISKAAEALYITQPNLSRQMHHLEDELGKQLFIRGPKKITLTEEGKLLRKRAEEIMDLYYKTENEITSPIDEVSGDIYIGGGESYALETIAKTIHNMKKDYPKVFFHLYSGDSEVISERLDKGLIDFGIFIEPFDLSKYEHFKLPLFDTWGVLMRKDSPLADKESIRPSDLWDKNLIMSRQSIGKNKISSWFLKNIEELNIIATGNLLYNLSLLVKENIGYAITLDKIINTSGDSSLCFRPLEPKLTSSLYFAYKKYQEFPKCAKIFLEKLKELI